MRSAVLLLIFNRPETTARVFDAVRRARPPRLYVTADGPRATHAHDAARCAEVRRMTQRVDWPCEVRTLTREHNLGCMLAVSQAISWFFDHESEGIVLEDDTLPLPSFFDYCDALLERYRNDARVAMISGLNPLGSMYPASASYFFSRHPQIWGWASWRRAWQGYDAEMADWPAWHAAGGLRRWFDGDACEAELWRARFDKAMYRIYETWDFQWIYHAWKQGGLAVLPAHNLVRNIGYGAEATHTCRAEPQWLRNAVPRDLAFPLQHLDVVASNKRADRLIRNEVLKLDHARCFRFAMRRAAHRLGLR
jgi:hypothetical protein